MAQKRDTVLDEEAAPNKALRSRAKHGCKPELEKLLELVNMIPPDHEMKTVHDLLGPRFNLAKPWSPTWLEAEEKGKAAFDENLKTFPESFQAMIHWSTENLRKQSLAEVQSLQGTLPDDEIEQKIRSKLIAIYQSQNSYYEGIRAARMNLIRLTEIAENVEHYRGKVLDVTLNVLLVENAYLDQNGIICRQSSGFAKAVEGVNVSRIRACAVCKAIFWAARKDKRCCSEDHSVVWRKRQSRLNKQEKGEVYAKAAKMKLKKSGSPRSKKRKES